MIELGKWFRLFFVILCDIWFTAYVSRRDSLLLYRADVSKTRCRFFITKSNTYDSWCYNTIFGIIFFFPKSFSEHVWNQLCLAMGTFYFCNISYHSNTFNRMCPYILYVSSWHTTLTVTRNHCILRSTLGPNCIQSKFPFPSLVLFLGSHLNVIFDASSQGIYIVCAGIEDRCDQFEVMTTFDNKWAMNYISLSSSHCRRWSLPRIVRNYPQSQCSQCRYLDY